MNKKIIGAFIDSTESEDSLSSTSSDSDDIEIIVNDFIKQKRNCIRNYFEEVVPAYSNEEFIRHFRINRRLYDNIADKFQSSEDFNSLDSSKVISAQKHIAIFLWFAGHEAASFRDLADRFDISLSTVSLIIERVTMFVSNLANISIIWPDEIKKIETAQYFYEKKGFAGIIGAVDGTKIVIDPPGKSKDDYIDRKNNCSLSMQGICDENKKFIDIFVGYPGSAHDSRVLKNSDVYGKLLNMSNEHHILGDSAYSCRSTLLTPYRDNGHLTAEQKHYNKVHSSCRVVIEHSFGILKQRFRQLYYCKLRGIKKLCHFIRACCVLHNLADLNEISLLEEVNENDDFNQDGRSEENDDAEGKRKRDIICQELQRRH